MVNDEEVESREWMAADKEKASKGEHRGRPTERRPRGILEESRNTMNPRIGSGAQQTRRINDGVNRQDGEKP